jgi:hypothetical protein
VVALAFAGAGEAGGEAAAEGFGGLCRGWGRAVPERPRRTQSLRMNAVSEEMFSRLVTRTKQLARL